MKYPARNTKKKPIKVLSPSKRAKALDDLYIAAGKWINANGGNAIIGGGIGLIHESEFKFNIVIKICGKAPEMDKS